MQGQEHRSTEGSLCACVNSPVSEQQGRGKLQASMQVGMYAPATPSLPPSELKKCRANPNLWYKEWCQDTLSFYVQALAPLLAGPLASLCILALSSNAIQVCHILNCCVYLITGDHIMH